jgi:hypothetical protein
MHDQHAKHAYLATWLSILVVFVTEILKHHGWLERTALHFFSP